MVLETLPFDAAEFLDDEAAQVDYLGDALGTNDASVIAHALGVVARARGMTQVARDAGVQRENLYRALSSTGRPELATVVKVIQSLGLRLQVAPAH